MSITNFNEDVIYFDGKDFKNGKLVYKSLLPVIIMIQGSYCGHCTDAKPDFQQAAQMNKQVTWGTIQVDEKDGKEALKNFMPDFNSGIPSYYVILSNGEVKKFDGGRDVDILTKLSKSIK